LELVPCVTREVNEQNEQQNVSCPLDSRERTLTAAQLGPHCRELAGPVPREELYPTCFH